jgi:hypothetical protein
LWSGRLVRYIPVTAKLEEAPLNRSARGRLFVALVFALGVLSFAGPAAAAPARVTTLIDETVGGAKQQASSAEIELLRLLREAGVPLVDEAQSRKIRSTTDAGTVLASGISGVITSLDADVIVAGVCTVSKLESALLGPTTVRYDAVLEGA